MLGLSSSKEGIRGMYPALPNWLIGIAIVLGALLLGIVIDVVTVSVLKHEAGPGQRTRQALARALRGQPEIWAVLIALDVVKPFSFLQGQSALWVNRSVSALAVLSVTLFFARLAGWLIRAYLSKDTVAAPSGSIFVNLTRLLIWAVGITFMLGVLGVQIGPLVASLGIVGLAVSLGLQDTLANFFSGLQITMSRQIQPGEYIRLSTTADEGTITDVTWRNTTMRAPSNDVIIVPNSVIARAQVTNYTAVDENHVASVPFSVAYGSDLEAVKRIAIEVARDVRDDMPDTVKEYEPVCRFRAFGPDGISAIVTIRVDCYQDRMPIVSELVERLHTRLIESGLEFGTNPGPAPAKPSAPPPPAAPAALPKRPS